MRTFRRDGIYRRRWFYWFPWGLTRWWLPGISRGGDEWCNDSVVLKAPFIGALVIFWQPGRLRTMPCASEWDEIYDDEARADYAPCGYYWNGRIHEDGHQHWESGICDEARKWLDLHDEIRDGLAAAERGETVDLGSFARYGSEDG